MRKELLVAVVFGILLGAFASYAVWKTNFQTKKASPTQTQVVSASEKNFTTPLVTTSTPPTTSIFEISSPEQHDVIEKSVVTVLGLAQPNSWVVVSGETKSELVKTNEDGAFESSVELTSGINQLVIHNILDIGALKEQSVLVVSSSPLPKPATQSQRSDTPTAADSLQERIKEAANKPRAYIGVVIDKTDTSMQIKDTKGTLLLVSLDAQSLSVEKGNNGTFKDISYSDVAIGDMVAALGYIGANEMLDAKKILLDSAGVNTVKVVVGKITQYSKRSVTITSNDGTEYAVQPQKTVSITQGNKQDKITFSDMEIGQTVIAAGSQNASTLNARRIQVVE